MTDNREQQNIARGLGKWSQPGVPHRGWRCLNVEDGGDPSVICEMCETQEIRYVHIMEHEDYPQSLRVGCICAGHMEGNLVRARGRANPRLRVWPCVAQAA